MAIGAPRLPLAAAPRRNGLCVRGWFAAGEITPARAIRRDTRRICRHTELADTPKAACSASSTSMQALAQQAEADAKLAWTNAEKLQAQRARREERAMKRPRKLSLMAAMLAAGGCATPSPETERQLKKAATYRFASMTRTCSATLRRSSLPPRLRCARPNASPPKAAGRACRAQRVSCRASLAHGTGQRTNSPGRGRHRRGAGRASPYTARGARAEAAAARACAEQAEARVVKPSNVAPPRARARG